MPQDTDINSLVTESNKLHQTTLKVPASYASATHVQPNPKCVFPVLWSTSTSLSTSPPPLHLPPHALPLPPPLPPPGVEIVVHPPLAGAAHRRLAVVHGLQANGTVLGARTGGRNRRGSWAVAETKTSVKKERFESIHLREGRGRRKVGQRRVGGRNCRRHPMIVNDDPTRWHPLG